MESGVSAGFMGSKQQLSIPLILRRAQISAKNMKGAKMNIMSDIQTAFKTFQNPFNVMIPNKILVPETE